MQRRPNGRLPVGFLLCVGAVALLMTGCGSSAIREVNKAAIASRVSYTDPTSRLLAQRSLVQIGERSTDYRVGPEDVMEITVFEWEVRNETRTVAARVAESGTISLPVLGELKVQGLTADEVKALIEKQLQERGILQAPRVTVTIKEFRSKRVAVVGAVHYPGVYTLRQNVTTLFEVLTLAGGTNERAGQMLYVIRAAGTNSGAASSTAAASSADAPTPATPSAAEKGVITIDLFELLEQGSLELNVVVQNGDVINVPEAQKVFVVGFVREPGGFPLTRPTTVLDAIAMAKGLREREASPRVCALKRQQPNGEIIIPLDLVAISHGREANLYLMPNDVIDVRQTTFKKIALEVFDAFKNLFTLGYSLNAL